MSKEKLKNKIRTSHFAPHTSNKGITLIALIITIIVMLILTGVTLSITLGDNGLVNKAKTASEEIQREIDRELLLSAVVGAIGNDGKVNLSAIVLPEGFTGSNGTYTSKNGHTFTVSENGEIVYTGEGNNGDNIIDNGGDAPSVEEPTAFSWSSVNLDNVDTSTGYKGYIQPLDMTTIASFTEDGKLILETDGYITDKIDATDSANIDETTGNLSFSVKIKGTETNIMLTMNENDIDAQIQGLGTITYIKQKDTIYSNKEVIKALGITNSTGTYRGTWTVIGTENGNKKLVSTSDAIQYELGYGDQKAIEAVSIAGTDATEEEKLQRSIWSYKNAVNSLNTVAQEATGITTARSIKVEDIYEIIGEENVNKGTEYGTVYSYYYNTETSTVFSKYKTGSNSWSETSNTRDSSQTFVNDNGETIVVDSAGEEVTLTNSYIYYELTDDQKKEIGNLANGYYCLASPYVECRSHYAYFRVRYMDYGHISCSYLFRSDGGTNGGRQHRGACRSYSTWSIISKGREKIKN